MPLLLTKLLITLLLQEINWMLLVSKMPGEVFKSEESLFLPLTPLKKSVHSILPQKEDSMFQHLVWMPQETSILKLLVLDLLLHLTMVLYSSLLSLCQVMSKIAQLKDKKLSKPFFVLLPNLLLELQKTSLITMEDHVEPPVPFQPLVLEDSKLLLLLTLLTPPIILQPPVKFKLMSNLLLLLLPPKLLLN
jgi:hypothetical protein